MKLKHSFDNDAFPTSTCKGRCEVRHASMANDKNKKDNSKIMLLPGLLYCTIKRARLAAKIRYVEYRVYTVTAKESIV